MKGGSVVLLPFFTLFTLFPIYSTLSPTSRNVDSPPSLLLLTLPLRSSPLLYFPYCLFMVRPNFSPFFIGLSAVTLLSTQVIAVSSPEARAGKPNPPKAIDAFCSSFDRACAERLIEEQDWKANHRLSLFQGELSGRSKS